MAFPFFVGVGGNLPRGAAAYSGAQDAGIGADTLEAHGVLPGETARRS
jgi:hypothetical protein